ncbi:MAG: cellulase family glycosylhydrolase [Defluviitaleaceae bacterium]|nr:cellulase family glycosylhydrolase [Defluviitaleaceae bacterium]
MKKCIFALAAAFILLFAPTVYGAVPAAPSAHGMFVDGWEVEISAYNIDGHNFFMLRDIAHALRNTSAEFGIDWDGERSAVILTTGVIYASAEGFSVVAEDVVYAVQSTAVIYVDGSRTFLRAYNINGHNYFMLRELGDALGFYVGWDAVENAVFIDTPPNAPEPMPEPQPETEPETESETEAEAESETEAEAESEPEPAPAHDPVIPVTRNGFNSITAHEWVSSIRAGWNLGNQLDARTNRGQTVRQMETAWTDGTPVTPQMINAVYAAGFNGIRIPVTWQKAMDNNFTIREDWMARVVEVVDYAVANDMFIMLNTHHDDEIFRLHDRYMAESRQAVVRIWEQIATVFADYSERLVFQGFNEPRTRGSAAEWSGGTAEERDNLNELNQLFVDTVRATGGNNAERVLVVPTYAASASAAAQSGLVVPTDTVADRIIVSMHHYSPWLFTLHTGDNHTAEWNRENNSDTSPIINYVNRAYNNFVSQGIPVVFSEAGAINRNNLAARVDWTEFYFSRSRDRGIPVFWWDNGRSGEFVLGAGGAGETFGIFERATGNADHPEIIDAIMRATED